MRSLIDSNRRSATQSVLTVPADSQFFVAEVTTSHILRPAKGQFLAAMQLLLANTSSSQSLKEAKINIHVNNVALVKVFEVIEEQS